MSEAMKDKYVEDYDNLMYEVGHTVQGVGRMMQSRLGIEEQGHEDLAAALINAARVIMICKKLEFPNSSELTVDDFVEMMFGNPEEE